VKTRGILDNLTGKAEILTPESALVALALTIVAASSK